MFSFYKDSVLENLGDGVKRRILVHDGQMMCVENSFERGAEGKLHSHPHEQITYVLSGTFDFTIGKEHHIVKQGDTLHKLPNVVHGCKCIEPGCLLDIFTPQREDFLK